jgi:ribonuclease-3
VPHNETLAFLGDAVIGLIIADLLVARWPEDGVGALTQRRALLVSTRSLAAWAIRLGLPDCLRLGRGESASGGGTKDSILATALEAVVGAVYREAGRDPVARLLAGLIDTEAC